MPFSLTVSYIEPHEPYKTTQQWWDKYTDDEVGLPSTPLLDAANFFLPRSKPNIWSEEVTFGSAAGSPPGTETWSFIRYSRSSKGTLAA